MPMLHDLTTQSIQATVLYTRNYAQSCDNAAGAQAVSRSSGAWHSLPRATRPNVQDDGQPRRWRFSSMISCLHSAKRYREPPFPHHFPLCESDVSPRLS